MKTKNRAPRIDGYAIQNTAHVLCALRAYELKLKASSPAQATKAAIDCYVALSHRPVTARTVRRWLATVHRYGGIERTPENAFGAKKACAHVRRPARDRLREIASEARRLSRDYSKGILVLNSRSVAEIALALGELDARVEKDTNRRHLYSIQQTARRMIAMPISKLCLFTSEPELERALSDLLVLLRSVKRSESAVQAV